MANHNSKMKECIDRCLECYRVCLETIHYCFEKGGEHAEATHIELLRNCATICETSAEFLISGSALHADTCQVCATVCQKCADNCAKFEGDREMQRCVDACRRCAESCTQMGGGRKRAA